MSRRTVASAGYVAALGLLLACSIFAGVACAQRSSSVGLDEAARREAVAAIPFDRLEADSREKLNAVVAQPTIYRRLPVTVVEADPDMYLFLVRYPEVVVNMWQLMGVTKVKVQRTGDYTLDAVDGAGTSGQVELVYGDRDTHVYYSEGAYEGPLFRHLIRGRCVLVLKSDYHRTMDQRVYVTNRLDMFVQLENIGAELIAKTLQPLVGRTADQNFVESSRFLSQVSLAAETKPDKLQNVAGRLTNLDPAVRSQFTALVRQVSNHTPPADSLHFTGVGQAPDVGEETLRALSGESAEAAPAQSAEPSQRGLKLRR